MKRNYSYVMQTNSNDCGVASIISILLYYGIKTTKEKILSEINITASGTTAYDLIKIAKSYNIDSYGIKDNIKNIKTYPLIAHTIKNNNMFHFIVIYEINKVKNTLTIMDPDIGITNLTIKKFEEISTGIFLVFKGKKQKIKNSNLNKEIKNTIYDNKFIVLKTFFLSILLILFNLIFNYYLKAVLTAKNLSYLFFVVLIYFVITLFKNGVFYLKNKLTIYLNIAIDNDLNTKISNHIFSLKYKYFISKTTGELITLSQDIEIYKQIITNVFISSFIDIIMLLIVVFYMFSISFITTLILVILTIIMIILTFKYRYVLNDAFVKLKRKTIHYNSIITEYFTSYETIKNLNLSSKIPNILYYNYNKKLKEQKNYSKKELNYSFISSFLLDIFYILSIFILALIIYKKGLSVYDIVLYSSVFTLYINFINNICESIYLYKIYEVSVNNVLDILYLEKENFKKSKFSKINTIEYKNICLKLGNKNIISNACIYLKKKDRCSLSGVSGVGKSMLMKTLLKYYDPKKGDILIDNINIKDIDLSFIRENITYVSQNESLFKGSIKDNLDICISDKEKQQEVLNITLFDKFLKDNNLDINYPLEENATNLSGGQKKKLILSRALLKFKEVLILDEVFNEISVQEEREILKNIFNKYKNKIIVVISHRNSNLDLFNKKYEIGDDETYEVI